MATQRAAKAGRIWAVEPLAHRRELARGIGADVAIEPGEAVEEILRGTGQRGVDCAIDCAAGEHTTSQAIQLARNAGRVALTGIHFTPGIAGRLGNEAQGADHLQCAPIEPRDRRGLELLRAHAEWFAPLLTHTRQIDRIDEAFAIASQYRDGVGKAIVTP